MVNFYLGKEMVKGVFNITLLKNKISLQFLLTSNHNVNHSISYVI